VSAVRKRKQAVRRPGSGFGDSPISPLSPLALVASSKQRQRLRVARRIASLPSQCFEISVLLAARFFVNHQRLCVCFIGIGDFNFMHLLVHARTHGQRGGRQHHRRNTTTRRPNRQRTWIARAQAVAWAMGRAAGWAFGICGGPRLAPSATLAALETAVPERVKPKKSDLCYMNSWTPIRRPVDEPTRLHAAICAAHPPIV
jgi:hypothetical protein